MVGLLRASFASTVVPPEAFLAAAPRVVLSILLEEPHAHGDFSGWRGSMPCFRGWDYRLKGAREGRM